MTRVDDMAETAKYDPNKDYTMDAVKVLALMAVACLLALAMYWYIGTLV
jgi:hypothetical protein